jgi:hypothetical protein
MWKETAVAYLKAIFRHLQEGTEEIREICIRLTGRDSNTGPLEYEGAVLPTQQRFFLNLYWLGYGSVSRRIVFRFPTLWPIRLPGQGLMRAMYLGVKRPGREFNRSTHPVTSLKMREAVLPLTCVTSCGTLRQLYNFLPFIHVLT